jgi:hypothetical protein
VKCLLILSACAIACAYRVNSIPIPVVNHSDYDVVRERWLGLQDIVSV